MNIGIIDYGMGNLRSVQWAFERLGATVSWVTDAAALSGTHDALVLPGVGAFPKGMDELGARGLTGPIRSWLADDRPFLGICLGFQLLFESSTENEGADGFGVFSGVVDRLNGPDLKVPQIGWNDITATSAPLDAFSGCYFYFVHSFAAPESVAAPHATTTYGRQFASAVVQGNVWGAQFHPERSGQDGLRFLQQFMAVPT